MEIIKLNINEVIPYSKNPRKNDNAVDAVAESIKQCGYCSPIVIDENNVILAGHTRLKALKKLKWKEVECVRKTGLTEEQKKKYRILDNKTNELAEWDFDLLEEEIDGLDFDGFDFGFDFNSDEDDAEIIEDEPPEVDEENEPITQLGDIWQLDEHRLMCGDSTDVLNINILMDGKKADLVFTDPPYGMKKEKDGVANDNLNYDDLLVFNKQWIPLTFDALKDNGSWYCWGIDEPLMDIYSEILKPMMRENKITFRNLITWDKGSGQGQNSEGFRMYPIADEKCLFIMCGVETTTSEECAGFENGLSTWYDGFEVFRNYFLEESKKAHLSRSNIAKLTNSYSGHYFAQSQYAFPTREHYLIIQEYCKQNDINCFLWDYDDMLKDYNEQRNSIAYRVILDKQKTKRGEWYSTRAYFNNTHDNMNNVWHFDRTGNRERELTGGHATPKPIALCSRAIKSSSREGEIVLDVFGGSGSTLIACEQLKRKAYLMELEPKWCDVIVKRWEEFTGKKAVKIN